MGRASPGSISSRPLSIGGVSPSSAAVSTKVAWFSAEKNSACTAWVIWRAASSGVTAGMLPAQALICPGSIINPKR